MRIPLLQIFAIVLTVGMVACTSTSEQSASTEYEAFDETDYGQPDGFFAQALSAFEAGDTAATVDHLGSAITFVRTLNYGQDSVHDETLNFSIEELINLQDDLQSGRVAAIDALEATFASVDKTIAAYHLAIVRDYFWNGTVNRRGLERMYRALVRLENAVQYDAYELTDDERAEIEGLKVAISAAEKTTPSLGTRVRNFFRKVDEKID